MRQEDSSGLTLQLHPRIMAEQNLLVHNDVKMTYAACVKQETEQLKGYQITHAQSEGGVVV
jgi:hypothetical protein